MKVIKYIAQILGAFVYTSVYVALICAITLFPIAWLLSLPLIWMLLLFFLFFSLIQGLIAFATNIVTLPYAWIVKGNGVALGVSIIHFIISLIMCAVGMWRANPEGFWQVTAIIILNVLLVETAVWVINALFNIYYRL